MKKKRNKKEFWKTKNKFKYKYPFVISLIKCMILSIFIIFIIWEVISIGTILSCDQLKISKEDLQIKFENSTVYDIDGNYLATLSSGTKRKCIALSEMTEYLPKAYIAIEDERFYEHFGVDLKRTTAATASFVTHFGKSDFGGSTITQQVVKNITEEKEDSANRKVKEMAKALQVEHYLNKDQILELYLNIIFIGGNDINGVELGAKHYFNKTAKDLSIAECAFMAGINHAPNGYKPFEIENLEMKEKINTRTKTVLTKMKELNYITEEQYNQAISEVDTGLKFEKGDTEPTTIISYQTEAALEQIVNQIMVEKNVKKELAEVMLYSGGLKIYTTQKTNIQEALESELSKSKYSISNGNQNSMATMAIMEQNTGNVVACGAGIGESRIKTSLGNFNYPTSLRKQTGSCMKPISVIAPGLENDVITGSTVFLDGDTYFGNYHPKNYYTGYKGAMTIRDAVAVSANIPHVKAISKIGVETSMNFCKSVGITGLGEEGLALSLGGLRNGTTVIEMAGAYNAIANRGVYVEPTFYSKVLDGSGNVYIEPKPLEQRSKRVMSEQNAYIEKNILESVVTSGTATYCYIPGMSVGAKTGTTNRDNDRWLCGFSPYYTAACWFGYEKNATVYYNGNPAGLIWSEVMRNIHTGLSPSGFYVPDGLARVVMCKTTGKMATSSCTNTYTEVFRRETVLNYCDGHNYARICNDSGLLATDSCQNVTVITYPKSLDTEQNAPWTTASGLAGNNVPATYCTIGHSTGESQQ